MGSRMIKDYNIKANTLKAVISSWRAKGISPGDAMKLMTLYLGAEQFLNPETMVYPKKMFNKIRKENGYRSIPKLIELIKQSESFTLIVDNANGEVVAFYSPLICDAENVAGRDNSVANRDISYLNNSAPIKGANNLNKNNLNGDSNKTGQGLRPMPLPELNKSQFLQKPRPEAEKRVKEYFYDLAFDNERINRLLYHLIDVVYHLCGEKQKLMMFVINAYLEDRVEPVFRRRIGIENWTDSQIDGWLQSMHQPRLARIKGYEAMKNWKERHAKDDISMNSTP